MNFWFIFSIFFSVFKDTYPVNFHLQGNPKTWNSNFLKWASGIIGGKDTAKRTDSTSPVNYCTFLLIVYYITTCSIIVLSMDNCSICFFRSMGKEVVVAKQLTYSLLHLGTCKYSLPFCLIRYTMQEYKKIDTMIDI